MILSWLISGLVLASGVIAALLILMYILPLDFTEPSPIQQISFSHTLHAGVHGISCRYCHRHVAVSRLAGIPSAADCRARRTYIYRRAPDQKLMAYRDSREQIPWVRVKALPDNVYFPHMMHIRARTDCSACHGGRRFRNPPAWTRTQFGSTATHTSSRRSPSASAACPPSRTSLRNWNAGNWLISCAAENKSHPGQLCHIYQLCPLTLALSLRERELSRSHNG